MPHTEEVNRLTECVYKGLVEQFNPTIRGFTVAARDYRRALTGVSVAAKGYFDSLVKLGELARDSQGTKELGDTLFQMAEVHRQVQVQMEEMVRIFHLELLTQLEQKLELDTKYLSATLKKYQLEIRAKSDSISKCHSELKKLRRRSQIRKNPHKHGDRELQCVELISRKQGELDRLVARGYTEALTEERRRYCFVVDRLCAISKDFSSIHLKVGDLLSQKLAPWMKSCSDPSRIPEWAMMLVQETSSHSLPPAGIPPSGPLRPGGGNVAPPGEASDRREFPGAREGGAGLGGAVPVKTNTPPSSSSSSYGGVPPAVASRPEGAEEIPAARHFRKESGDDGEGGEAARPVDRLSQRGRRPRVRALFAHSAGNDGTLLSFQQDDIITVLVPDAKDGWLYGESQATNKKGWFPYSYTQPIQETFVEKRCSSNSQNSRSNSSSTGKLDQVGLSPGFPGNAASIRNGNTSVSHGANIRTRPFSLMDPDIPQLAEGCEDRQRRTSRENPFANVQLRHTITDDRSAPVVR